jgi:hypothetical protein
MSTYDDLLLELKQKGSTLANQYINELYNILRDEEKLPPADCRAKIEHDCIDLWSKATIMKFMPLEAKDTEKQKAGKIGGESKSKKKALLLASGVSDDGARINLAENDSVNQNETESSRFRDEDNPQSTVSGSDGEFSESGDATTKSTSHDNVIDSPKKLIQEVPEQTHSETRSSYGTLTLSSKFARDIHDLIDYAHGNGHGNIPEFRLHHNGRQVTEVKVAF